MQFPEKLLLSSSRPKTYLLKIPSYITFIFIKNSSKTYLLHVKDLCSEKK